jgi:hypothetical protein
MKILKRVLIVLGSLLILMFIFSVIYWMINRQGVAESFEVGSVDMNKKVLIASQGSEYKNLMVDTLTSRLKGKDIYISVIDISKLNEINQEDWDAQIIIHTTESWKLPDPVKEYLDKIENTDEVTLLITSGSGEWKPEACQVDILTSASKVTDIPVLANSIEGKINSLFEEKD